MGFIYKCPQCGASYAVPEHRKEGWPCPQCHSLLAFTGQMGDTRQSVSVPSERTNSINQAPDKPKEKQRKDEWLIEGKKGNPDLMFCTSVMTRRNL